MAMEATRDTSGTLVDVIDRILDKGLVINVLTKERSDRCL